jgi:hypothetical protein
MIIGLLCTRPIRNWYLLLGQKPRLIMVAPWGLCRKNCVYYRLNQPDPCKSCEVAERYLGAFFNLPGMGNE